MQRGASATKNVAIIDDFSKKKVQTSIRHNMADEQNEESLVPPLCCKSIEDETIMMISMITVA